MKRFKYTIAVIGIISLFSCGKSQQEKAAEQPQKMICVLFDLSLSTATPEVRHAYSQDMSIIIDKMNHGDVIVAGLITEKSLSELKFGLLYEFPPFRPSTDNPLYRQAELRQFDEKLKNDKDSLKAAADSILMNFNQRIMRTEIISALQVVERIFKSYNQLKPVLVIMSDMIEDSQLYNFYHENLTQQRIKQIIETERKQDRLPDLQGAKVYVIGAMAKRTKKFLQIEDFWIDYFQACGANLSSENYGTTLIRFP